MKSYIIPIILGIFIVILGICNMKGNINSIHWYHRKRVTAENKKIFGKLVGIGTLLCGVGIIIYGVFSVVGDLIKSEIVGVIGSVILVILLILGIFVSFYAMIKYNKGIF